MKIFIGDTETTGLGADARVVEYAHIECRLEGNKLVEVGRFESLINPLTPIPAEATKVHGITDEMVKDAPCIRDVLPLSLGLLKNEHALMIGHNFRAYDMIYLDGLIPQSVDIGCTLKAARVFVDAPKRSLDFLREHLKMGEALAHSALGDCVTTLELVNHMLQSQTWETLLSCMIAPLETISFGKHKGTKLEDLPEDYVDWLMHKCDNLSWDMRRALKELA